jgi:purine-binding chemotaxis protein CheW
MPRTLGMGEHHGAQAPSGGHGIVSGDACVVLLIRAGQRKCALPINDVVETFRPLPVEVVAGVPPFVAGVALIRGNPTPVLDLRLLLEGGEERRPHRRFVLLKVDRRRVALAVDEVWGVRRIPAWALDAPPPLLSEVSGQAIAALGVADEQLLTLLRAVWLLPTDEWQQPSDGSGA